MAACAAHLAAARVWQATHPEQPPARGLDHAVMLLRNRIGGGACRGPTSAIRAQDFEPYVLVAKQDVPPYDERLRGYFENKAVHIRHMAARGVGFVVHPTAFVVHMPHPPSAARQWIIDPANQATRDLIQASPRAARDSCLSLSKCAMPHKCSPGHHISLV